MIDEHPSEARMLLAFDRELDAGELSLVEGHVHACPACRATWDRLARLSGEIEQYCRALPPEPASAAAPAVGTRPIWKQLWQAPWQAWLTSWPNLVAGTMAMLLIVYGTDLARRSSWFKLGPLSHSFASSDAPVRQGDLPLPSASPESIAANALNASSASSALDAAAVPRRRARPRAATEVAATQGGRPTPTYYWTLPYANDALPLSEGSVVMTVRLSRDQLRLAGIPVSVSQPVSSSPAASDRSLVRAKVLIGADGLPRAISFDQD